MSGGDGPGHTDISLIATCLFQRHRLHCGGVGAGVGRGAKEAGHRMHTARAHPTTITLTRVPPKKPHHPPHHPTRRREIAPTWVRSVGCHLWHWLSDYRRGVVFPPVVLRDLGAGERRPEDAVPCNERKGGARSYEALHLGWIHVARGKINYSPVPWEKLRIPRPLNPRTYHPTPRSYNLGPSQTVGSASIGDPAG